MVDECLGDVVETDFKRLRHASFARHFLPENIQRAEDFFDCQIVFQKKIYSDPRIAATRKEESLRADGV